jgi:DNA-binding transcriptional regulator PaaX
MKRGLIQKRIILLAGTWLKLGNSFNIENYLKTFKEFYKEWDEIADSSIKRSFSSLIEQGYLYEKYNNRNVLCYELSKKGKKCLVDLEIENIKIKRRKVWDKKWRIVIFDIPEKYRGVRNLLRKRLVELGFYKIQQSVFVIPYSCRREIKKLSELLQIHECVHFIEALCFDDDSEARKYFEV